MASYIITSDSLPVYKDWPWSDAWGCAEWIKFRTELGKKYKPDEADYLWGKLWLDGVSQVSGGTGAAIGSGLITDSVPLSCRTFDSNFKAFLESYPNLKSAVFSGIGGLIARPISLGVTVFDSLGNIIGNTATGLSDTSKLLKWLIPAVIVLVVIGALIYFGNKYKIFKLS